MSFFGQPPLAALLPLQAGQNLADLPNTATALANLGTLSTSNIMMNAVPMGTIIPYWGSTAPVGYLPCNGQTINSGTFPDLVTFLGGTTSAVVPDLRGEFLRGWDNGRGLDAGRGISTTQTDALQNITGAYSSSNGVQIAGTATTTGAFSQSNGTVYIGSGTTATAGTSMFFDASRVARTSTETRPHNVSVLYCIKAYGAVINTSTANMGNVLSQLSTTVQLSQFGVSTSSSGYQKLPSGLILQWIPITTTVFSNGFNFVNLPISFPTAGLLAVASGTDISQGTFGCEIYGATQLRFTNSYAGSQSGYALVIGY